MNNRYKVTVAKIYHNNNIALWLIIIFNTQTIGDVVNVFCFVDDLNFN